MIKKNYLLTIILLLGFLGLTACSNSPTTVSEPEVRQELDAVIALVDELKQTIETDYKLGAEVWNNQLAVISVEVEDPATDFSAEVPKIQHAACVQNFEGKLRTAFLHPEELTEAEKASGLKSSTNILGTYDAKTGKPTN